MGFFFGRKNKNISRNAAFRLTQEGREKLQKFGGDTLTQILEVLADGGTSNIDEISSRSELSRGQVERLIPQMIRSGFIQEVNTSMATELD